MNSIDAITYAAHAEARRTRPLCDPDELELIAEDAERALPYISLARDDMGKWQASGHGHAGHDNAPRMPYVCDWLQRSVLPLLDPGVDVSGAYRIELHDCYSYLVPRRPRRHVDAMGFGRPAGEASDRMALIPDPFQMDDYGGLLRIRDTVPWEAKEPRMFFAGSTTGNRDPVRNERIRACLWGLSHRDVASFHITNIVQMTPDSAFQAVPLLRAAVRPTVPVEDHFRYRYQVNIAGNSACWSRVPMIMASSCLMLNLKQRDQMWYHPFMSDGTHYVGVPDIDELPKVREFCMANEGRCRHIVDNANRFVSNFLSSYHAAAYMTQFLETCALLGSPRT